MDSRTSYQGPMIAAVICLLLGLGDLGFFHFPNFAELNAQRDKDRELASHTADINRQVDQDIAKLDAQERYSQRLNDLDMPQPHNDLMLLKYVYDPNVRPDVNATRYPSGVYVKVWDEKDTCSGIISNSTFFFRGEHPDACTWLPKRD